MLDLTGKLLKVGDHVTVYNYKGKPATAPDKEAGIIAEIMKHNLYVNLGGGSRVFTSGIHLSLMYGHAIF